MPFEITSRYRVKYVPIFRDEKEKALKRTYFWNLLKYLLCVFVHVIVQCFHYFGRHKLNSEVPFRLPFSYFNPLIECYCLLQFLLSFCILFANIYLIFNMEASYKRDTFHNFLELTVAVMVSKLQFFNFITLYLIIL